MTELLEFLKVYKDFGVAGLFIALELVTVWLFYKELKNSKEELVTMTKLVITALDSAANAIEDMNSKSDASTKSVNDIRTQNEKFQAFLQGRDENNYRRRSS